MARAETIDDVVAELESIIAWCEGRGSRLGYFPALYRKVTVAVRDGLAVGRFEDAARMERLDVVFANRYLDAFDHYRRGEPITRAWAYTFRMAERAEPLILQHLLLGMNAHINLDLGVAAAEIAPGRALAALRRDFDVINGLLQERIDEVQAQLSRCSPIMPLLDYHADWVDEAIASFSLRIGRRLAWHRALMLGPLAGKALARRIESYDRRVALYARALCPEYISHPAQLQLRALELQDVRAVIRALAS